MKQALVVSFYVATIGLVGCRVLASGATALGNAALKLGYYHTASTAFKLVAKSSPHDVRTLAALAKAEVLAGEEVDAFGNVPYNKLIIRENG